MASPRVGGRYLKLALFAVVLLFCGYNLNRGSPSVENNSGAFVAPRNSDQNTSPNGPQQVLAEPEKAVPEDSKVAVKNPKVAVQDFDAAVPDSKVPVKDTKAPTKDSKDTAKDSVPAKGPVKAALVALARNSDIPSMSNSIRQIEERFNKNYKYDWVFLNDEPFDDTFKKAISALVSGEAKFGTVPKEHWSYPEWIDKEKAAYAREDMVQRKIIYGGSVSYRHMCRYESGFFYRHELMQDYEYYWRVDPDIKLYCDIDYDVFQFMKDNDKKYGFTISLHEYQETIPTLWDTTREFIDENPQYLDADNNMAWLSDDQGQTYNGCHFWSNFEIASLDFFRSEAYSKYFDHLDKAGGFFYERWGDAPVHSIAVSLFAPKNLIHYFNDIGYYHVPFNNCPVDEATRTAKNCVCSPKKDFTWRPHSCTPRFHTLLGLKRPKGWENFTE